MSRGVDSDRTAELEDCWPWTSRLAEETLARLREGRTWKQCFETALLELDPERADHLMLLAREARAAWLVMISGEPSRALCIGNACSGAAVALARAGHQVVLVD
ncbi:MAG: hypothetical protein ABIP42_06425, partial [Planctomycetota bacterium]